MRFFFSSYFLFLFLIEVQCQDIILFNTGEENVVRVLEITEFNVIYKVFSNLDGPSYSKPKSDIFMITFANGEKEVFQEISSIDEEPISSVGKTSSVFLLRVDSPYGKETSVRLEFKNNDTDKIYKFIASETEWFYCISNIPLGIYELKMNCNKAITVRIFGESYEQKSYIFFRNVGKNCGKAAQVTFKQGEDYYLRLANTDKWRWNYVNFADCVSY